MTNIENPYKVNSNHHWNKDMSADLVEEIYNGKMMWKCYLFAANAVTPMRVVEFSTLNDCEQWAKDKGSEIWTYFGLDYDEINSDMRIVSRNHDTGKVTAKQWEYELIERITRAYSLGTIEEVISLLMNNNPVNCPNATFSRVHKDRIKTCARCKNTFVYSDTAPNQSHCTEICWQLDNSNRFKPGQTIDKKSCIETTLRHINDDVSDLSQIECVNHFSLAHTEIIFVDDNGNQYEYDGVCISEGKLKIAIKSNNPLGLKIKKRYVNSDGKLVTDLLPFNFETNEAIRKERELMPAENFLTRSEIDLYLNDGFTINTYQASYCKEGHEFSPIEESK